MAEIINMPRLSDTMEEGVVAKWLKNVGDKVEEGDILAEIETDKATMEFESFYEGTLLHIGIEEGDGAPVDSLLAIIGEEGEDISAYLSGDSGASKSEAKEDKKEEPKSDAPKEEVTETPKGEIPEDVVVVTMPRLSDTMEEGTVATWLKKEGDQVEEGDILAEIETDKATMEFESFQSGTLLYIGLQEGETAKVDSLLAIVGTEGTDDSGIAENFKTGGSVKKEEAPQKETAAKSVKEEKNTSSSSTSSSTSDTGRVFVSPLARKMAEEKGINLSQVKGSGESGRVIKRD